jgi:hypothetical protein
MSKFIEALYTIKRTGMQKATPHPVSPHISIELRESPFDRSYGVADEYEVRMTIGAKQFVPQGVDPQFALRQVRAMLAELVYYDVREELGRVMADLYQLQNDVPWNSQHAVQRMRQRINQALKAITP